MQRRLLLAGTLLITIGVGLAGLWWLNVRYGEASLLSDRDRAFARVARRPKDPAAWMALGDAHDALDEVDGAEYAYRTAIGRADESGQLTSESRARLGFLLYGQGRDDEARTWLEAAMRMGNRDPMVVETLARLAEVPRVTQPPRSRADVEVPVSAPPVSYPEAVDAGFGGIDASVPVRPAPEPQDCWVQLEKGQSGVFQTIVIIDGTPLLLLLDTGASVTVLNRSAADSAGLAPLDGRLLADTANGITEMSLAWAESVELAGRALEGARVAVCDECIRRADGLLGVDLQARFDVQVDVVAGRLSFVACE